MALDPSQMDVLKSFCALILCGHHEDVFQRCKECLENAADEYGGIPEVLYVLSGQDIDADDPFGNVADEDKQLVKPQYYLISSDAGAPALEDFFWFIENIKAARGLDFTVNEENFSDDDCIVEWLAELSAQLKDLSIVNFDGASEDYHFTIMNHDDCEKVMKLFERMTAHIDGYHYSSFVITSDFQG
ncbi:MAG: hypothetical protein K2J95_10690 [Lachnospiraceae bacterium]|nr:hypothetical protein [Lachnospiraceae bacterium]